MNPDQRYERYVEVLELITRLSTGDFVKGEEFKLVIDIQQIIHPLATTFWTEE